jgi:hypothetical protein
MSAQKRPWFTRLSENYMTFDFLAC